MKKNTHTHTYTKSSSGETGDAASWWSSAGKEKKSWQKSQEEKRINA